jgi:cytochrome c oxidase subunit II
VTARRGASALVLGIVLAGCSRDSPSILDTHGSEASTIAGVWWLMFGLGAAVYAVVGGFIIWAIVRGRQGRGEGRVSDDQWIIWGGVAIPIVILGVLAVTTVRATAELRRSSPHAVRLEVVGKRWWWQVTYPGYGFTTANEVHLPAGQPAEIGLDSDNVIHSFRVPQLAGTVDLIPGQHNVLRFTPRTAGTYRGVCAEFCGIEHAKMQFLVVVQSPADFDRWAARQQVTPSPPDGESAAEGQLAFMRQPCAGCHTIRGTQAHGVVGPDLTGIGGRQTLAAGTVPNSPGELAAWISDAQAIKPGALMPPISISARDLNNLVAYLEGLK